MLVVIGTDCTGNCKSNYHTIMTVPTILVKICIEVKYLELNIVQKIKYESHNTNIHVLIDSLKSD